MAFAVLEFWGNEVDLCENTPGVYRVRSLLYFMKHSNLTGHKEHIGAVKLDALFRLLQHTNIEELVGD